MKVMIWNKIFLVFGIWLEHASGVLRGRCEECLPNSVACLDEVSFTICKDGVMTNNLVNCPSGKVCTSEPSICLARTDGFSPVCYQDNCNTCESTNGVFACLDERTYSFCYDGTDPDPSSIKTCPIGRVCSLEDSAICVLESDGGIPSCIPEITTTETTTTETTTTEPTPTPTTTQGLPIDPDVFCARQQKKGNFKAPDDLTCKEYIYCYLLSGEYLGQRYYCAAYFNPTSGRCQTDKPSEC